jgi:superfamily II DNA or RNA helicase
MTEIIAGGVETPPSTLRELQLLDSYDSSDPGQDIACDFLIPVLEVAETYDRLSGYFNSGMLAAAPRGMASFLSRGKKMRVIASPQFSNSDIEALKSGISDGERLSRIEKALSRGIENLDAITDEFEKDHVAAFCWALQSGQIEIRIAIPLENAAREPLFHTKIGFVSDKRGDSLSFSGSINETAAGWSTNIEEFKVFESWASAKDAGRCFSDRDRFLRFWNESGKTKVQVFSLPEAIEKNLLKLAPKEESFLRLTRDRYAERAAPSASRFDLLRTYQKRAVERWELDSRRGLLVMATGTGKTKTAAAAIERAREQEERLLVVVTAPQQHIAAQWASELADMDPVTSWGAGSWRRRVSQRIDEISIGYRKHLLVIMVQQSGAKDETQALWRQAEATKLKSLLVADEAHGLGAKEMRKNLAPSFDWRLGLTATPDRYFDDEGKSVLQDYFVKVSDSFSIDEALKWIDPVTGNAPLCQYRYFPYFFQLEPEEVEEYEALTKKAIRKGAGIDRFGDGNDDVAKLLIRRANIVKTSKAKMPAFRQAIKDHAPVTQAIVYCQDTVQLNEAASELGRAGYLSRRFTGDEGTKPEPRFGGDSERARILRDLASGAVGALVAMRCLDEGVDVPSAQLGFLLASSGNPREFIQRRGRILRPFPGKRSASIVDFVCVPPISEFADEETRELERSIFKREILRMFELSGSAINSLEVTMKLDALRAKIFEG